MCDPVVATPCQDVTVTTMCASYIIIRPKRCTGACRYSLLPDIWMQEAGHESSVTKLRCAFLKPPDQHHDAVELSEEIARVRCQGLHNQVFSLHYDPNDPRRAGHSGGCPILPCESPTLRHI